MWATRNLIENRARPAKQFGYYRLFVVNRDRDGNARLLGHAYALLFTDLSMVLQHRHNGRTQESLRKRLTSRQERQEGVHCMPPGIESSLAVAPLHTHCLP